MTRRVRRALAALAAVAAVAAVAASGADADAPPGWSDAAPPVEQAAERPNIVVLYTDDQTVAQMRAMPATTEWFAANGVRFTNNMTTFPLCCPSRATFLTGQYTHNHGVNANFAASGGGYRTFADRAGARSLAVALDQAGYHTGWVGKYLNEYGDGGAGNPATEIAPGWDDFRPAVGAWSGDYWRTRINDNGRVRDLSGTYSTDAYAEIAGDMVRDASAQPDPFFLVVSFFGPHTGTRVTATADGGTSVEVLRVAEYAPRHARLYPNAVAPRTRAFNEPRVEDKPALIQRFYGEPLTASEVAAIDARWRSELRAVAAVDEAVTSIREDLAAAGELDNTVIIFTSDNGFMHGEHRVPSLKYVPYRQSREVPLYIAAPDARRGATYNGITANIDLAPTILDYAQAAPIAPVDGMSLRPAAVAGTRPAGHGRPVLLYGGMAGARVRPAGYLGIRWGRWVMWTWRAAGNPTELYDLRVDPNENRNVAADPANAAVIASLAAMRDQLAYCAGPTCRPAPAAWPGGGSR